MLKTHQFMLETNVASDELKDIYDLLISGKGKEEELFAINRQLSSVYFLKRIITDFLSEIKAQKANFIDLAISLSNTQVSVWVIINNNDEESENKIIMAEAKINAKYSDSGFYIDSMIVEESDKYPTPGHYQKVV
jgi:hypothetical protein